MDYFCFRYNRSTIVSFWLSQPRIPHAGIGTSTVSSLVAVGILFTKKNYLSLALNDVKTIEELQEIVNTIQASDCNCSLIGCVTGYGSCVGANMDFIFTSTKLKGTVSDFHLQCAIDRILGEATNNGKNPLDGETKVAFERLCALANEKCGDYPVSVNHFELYKDYLK